MAKKTSKPAATDNKAGGNEKSTASSMASTIERILRHFQENGKLVLSAQYVGLGRYPCTIDNKWSIHGVTHTNDELSFIASMGDQRPIKFDVTTKFFIQHAVEWFQEMAAILAQKMAGLVEAIIPPTIVFQAGVTEYVGRRVAKA